MLGGAIIGGVAGVVALNDCGPATPSAILGSFVGVVFAPLGYYAIAAAPLLAVGISYDAYKERGRKIKRLTEENKRLSVETRNRIDEIEALRRYNRDLRSRPPSSLPQQP
jgi:hypothetical protein